MSTCNKCQRGSGNSHNIVGNCPVFKMDDGRHFTDWGSQCQRNNSLVAPTVLDSYSHRMYLQHNAEKLMKGQQAKAEDDNRCSPCFDFNSSGTMLPEESMVVCDKNTCNWRTNYNAGFSLGQGRDYFSIKSRTPLLSDKQKAMPKGDFLELYR